MEDIKKSFIKKIICKKCGAEIDFSIYPIINFSDKNITDQTYSLELFECICPKCNSKTFVQYDTIIVDGYKRNLIYLYGLNNKENFYTTIMPKFTELFSSNEEISNILKNVKHSRLVRSPSELLEKLLIFDYDLDDRIIELLKINLFGNKDIQNFQCIQIFFDKLEKDKLLFTCISKEPNNKPKQIGVSFTHYNDIIDYFNLGLEKSNLNFDSYNLKWAEEQYDKLNEKQQ